MSLNEREKYCLALIIVKGGEASYYEIRDTILESKGPFRELSEKYLKYKAIKKTLLTLVKKNNLSEEGDPKIFEINPLMELGFIQQHPIPISKAIKSNLKYREEHILEFNTSEIEAVLLDEETFKDPPYELLENLKEALQLQKMGSYDSVLVKCGKCVEIMVHELDYDYTLFNRKLSTGKMIKQLRNEDISNKVTDKVDKDDFITFIDGISVVYRFRNIMGAHSGWTWGQDQVATSCLILALYLVDLYTVYIRKEAS